MILLETGSPGEAGFDGMVHFAMQLSARGHPVVIDERAFPEGASRSQSYDAAPFLAALDAVTPERVILLGAETIADEVLQRLRRATSGGRVPVSAIGAFQSHQDLVGAATKIAYATGQEPQVLNLEQPGSPAARSHASSPQVGLAVDDPPTPRGVPTVLFVLPADWLEDAATLSLLGAMAQLPDFVALVVSSGKAKETLRNSGYSDIPAFGYSDLPPRTLAGMADVAVFLGDAVPGERMMAVALEMMASSRLVVDSTAGAGLAGAGAPVLRGPEALSSAAAFVERTVIPNRAALGREAGASPWARFRSFQRLEQELGLAENPGLAAPEARAGQTVFVPTNGVGLGHARRCTLIATEMKRPEACSFMAFPSCVPLVQGAGFGAEPLVARSETHDQDHANDIVNYLRMRRRMRRGDTLVFDGGYVFESIYRTILEKDLNAVWIRRGRWQAGQMRAANLEREKAFDLVIAPDEAFAGPGVHFGLGPKVRSVAPIVDVAPLTKRQVGTIRAKLARRFGSEFETLVVTMLGGGVAADRSAQIQAISNQLAERRDVLHLVVVWPGSRIAAGLGWQGNTFVVRTWNAMALAQAADFAVSAAGYNSFHEIIYNRVPAIFIPQVAPILDDQEARARGACERGLGALVRAQDLLLLERELMAFLDDGKAAAIRKAMQAAHLPEPGNAAAARLIEECVRHE